MAAKRSYPTSQVRGSGREYQTVTAQGWPSRATPHPRSGGGGGREEIPHATKPEAKGGGWEGQPHFQGAMAVREQEGLEQLSHIEGQEGWQ